MSKEKTLEKVNSEISRGNLGRARDRLHGLICAYPNELDLRPMLAEIYYKLQQPAMAGRYWYLEENQTDEMKTARAEFENSCGQDQLRIWLALKFKGDISALPPGHANDALQKLFDSCREKHPRYFEKGLLNRAERKVTEPVLSIWERLTLYGCLISLVAATVLMVIGLVTVLRLIF